MPRILKEKDFPLSSVVCLFLCSLIFLLYAQSLTGGFVLDDWYVIAQNPTIKEPGLLKNAFTENFFSSYRPSPQFQLNYYRPVTLLSFALDYQIWGLSPFGYRLVNILLHALNAFLFYRMVVLFFKEKELALLSAVFFSILPVHEWAVNHIIGRGGLLEIFFVLLSIVNLLYYLEGRKKTKYVLSLLFLALAILSREIAVVFIAIIFWIIFNRLANKKQALFVFIPFLSVVLAYAALRLLFFSPFANAASYFSLDHVWQWFLRFGEFNSRFLVPWGIQSYLKFKLFVLPITISMGCLMVFLCVAGIFILKKPALKYRPIFIFACGWLIINLLPLFLLEGVIRRLGPGLSEYLLYGVSFGFALGAGCLILNFGGIIQKLIILLLFSYFTFIVFLSNSYWENNTEEGILKKAMVLDGDWRYIAGRQLLMKYVEDEEMTKALIREASGLFSKSLWQRRLGQIYSNRGDLEAAEASFRDSISSNPRNVEAYEGWAVALLNNGKIEEGRRLLEKSLSVNAKDSEIYRLLGLLHYRNDNFMAAIPYFEKAVYYNPDDIESLLSLAISHFFLKQEDLYQKRIDQAIKKTGDTAFMIRRVAPELYRHGYFKLTASLLESAKDHFIQDPEMLHLLRSAYERAEEGAKAGPPRP